MQLVQFCTQSNFSTFSVQHIYIFYVFKYSFKNFFVTTDENGAYQATIDIGAIYVLLLSIIHF